MHPSGPTDSGHLFFAGDGFVGHISDNLGLYANRGYDLGRPSPLACQELGSCLDLLCWIMGCLSNLGLPATFYNHLHQLLYAALVLLLGAVGHLVSIRILTDRLTGLGPLHCLGAGLATIALAGVGAGIRAGLKGHADTRHSFTLCWTPA